MIQLDHLLKFLVAESSCVTKKKKFDVLCTLHFSHCEASGL